MNETRTPSLEISGSRLFTAWLAGQKASLAFTTYQAGKLFLIGLKPDGGLSVSVTPATLTVIAPPP